MRYTEKYVRQFAQENNLIVKTWSPGDGVTRYRFFKEAPANQTYFGPKDGVFTALGAREAMAFIKGRM